MLGQWVVLLEAAGDPARNPIHAGDVKRLHEALDPGPHGGALDCPSRYALQVTATGASPVDALLDVVARWTHAVHDLGLPAWDLVRTEVFTPEDLEREFESAHRGEAAVRRPEPDCVAEEYDEIGHDLLHRAFADPLTGLLGRPAFAHRLEDALARNPGHRPAAVVRLDLDGFQRFNHLLGGAAGDQLLTALAQRLAAMVRPRDVLARLGGDEYGLLLEDSTEEVAVGIADRMLQAVRLPMTIGGHDLTLAASAGVVMSQPGESAEVVLSHAGAALRAAKTAGGDRPVLYGSDVSPQPAQTGQDFATVALQDRLAHVQLMQQAAVAANGADNLHQAAQVVMRHICAQIGCVMGRLWVSPAPSDEVQEAPLWHMADGGHHQGLQEAAEELLTGPGVGLAGRILASGRPVWIADVVENEATPPHRQAATAGLESAFAFPVLVGREVVAVLAFFSRTRMEPTDSFLDVLVGIGTQLGRVVERRRAVEALRRSTEHLRASEARLRDAEALTRLGSWHFDLHTGEGRWSDGTGALYGMDPRQPLDLRSALAAVHAEDRPRMEAALSLLMEKGESFADEIRVVRPDGPVRWHRVQGSAVRDDNGVVVALQGTSQDITEEKLAHEALRDRERQLAEAQRAARLGCWELELSSGRLTWSEEMCRLWGWESDREVTREAFLATVHPDDRQRLLEEGTRLQETGEPSCVDFRAIVADGRERWFRGGAHVVLDETGRAVKLFGTDQDITEQKQAEQDLQRTQALYERIIETTHEGIMTMDAQYVVTFVNPRMAQMLGYSIDEMTGVPVSTFMGTKTFPGAGGHRQRRRDGMSEHYQTRLRAKDGALIEVLVSASPFMDEDGNYAGALAMVTDVTAVREAEDIVRSQSLRIQAEVDEGTSSEKPPSS